MRCFFSCEWESNLFYSVEECQTDSEETPEFFQVLKECSVDVVVAVVVVVDDVVVVGFVGGGFFLLPL